MYQYWPNGCADGCFCVEPQHFDSDGFGLDQFDVDRDDRYQQPPAAQQRQFPA
jgi:hypothetical protein